MYCPNCAALNNEGTKFCRSCGSNLSLVPQALAGRISQWQSASRKKKNKEKKPPSLSEGIVEIFTGFGFLLVSLAVFFFAPAGKVWWFWLLLPAFSMMGKGIAEIVSAKKHEALGSGLTPQNLQAQNLQAQNLQAQNLQAQYPQAPYAQPPRAEELPPRNTGPIFPPPSVTENTTRHLDSARERAKENN